MHLEKGQKTILLFTFLYLLTFSAFYIGAKNYEFLLYIGIIVIIFALILSSNRIFHYSNLTLWGLSLWGLLHMAGGGVMVGDTVLYGLILVPISSTYEIFKFDQFVHIFGFGVATILMFELLKPSLKAKILSQKSLLFVLVMAGLGAGALNEIIEFFAVVITPETGVGGYNNTALDLVSNLIGALVASLIIKKKYL